MIEKSCRCGKIKKNFFMDIGPFFIGDCCIEAGYDHKGNLVKELEAEQKVSISEETETSTLQSEKTEENNKVSKKGRPFKK